MLFLAIQQLVQLKSIDRVPSHITGSTPDNFCEDCVNRKLTWVPHSKPATHAEVLLLRAFLDVHGPVPV
jgi:hypothetical protein